MYEYSLINHLFFLGRLSLLTNYQLFGYCMCSGKEGLGNKESKVRLKAWSIIIGMSLFNTGDDYSIAGLVFT